MRIRLYVEDRVMRVAQVGESSLILRESCECPPESEGEIEIVVDGFKSVYRVILDDGIAKDIREVRFSDIQASPPQAGRPLFCELDDLPF